MRVTLVVGTSAVSGITRYANELLASFERRMDPRATVMPVEAHVVGAGLVRRFLRMDIESFVRTYPIQPLRGNADMFHLTYQSLASCLWSPPKQPVVVTVHDLFPRLYRHDLQLRHYNHKIHEWVDAAAMHLVSRADAIITDTRTVRDDVMSVLGIDPSRVHTVALAVDHSRFHPVDVPETFRNRFGLRRQQKVVLHVSSEEPRKNITGLIQAWRHVVRRVSDSILIKVGRPRLASDRAGLLADIERYGLTDTVRIFDEVSNTDLVHLYNAADVFVFPSIAEGFGLPVLEAMACGTAVVCSDAPALQEIARDATVQVPAVDTEQLAREVVRLLESESDRRRLGAAGRERAALFTWDRTAESTYQVYTHVLQRA